MIIGCNTEPDHAQIVAKLHHPITRWPDSALSPW